MAQYKTSHNPRTDGTMNVTDAINAGGTVQAWAPSSGIGGGGYRGRGGYGGGGEQHKTHGYSFQNQGTAADFFQRNGGMSAPKPSLLNELYRNQPGQTMGAFDQLQSQKAMDEADPNAAHFANQASVANGAGAYDKADFFNSLLQNRLAEQQAANGGGGGTSAPEDMPAPGSTPAPAYHRPGETRYDQAGNKWQWDEQAGHGINLGGGITEADMIPEDEAALQGPGGGSIATPYGAASVSEQPTETTFTNAHGSAGPGGVRFTGPRMGSQTAADFFGDRADFTGSANKFASPSPGYGANKGTSKYWGQFNSALAKKRLLGKAA